MRGNRKTIFAVAALAVAAALMLGIWYFTRPQTQAGAKTVAVEVVHSGESFILVAPAPELDQSVEKDAKRIIRPGEQVIVSARGLFDGKVLT